jgi:hypothetical protein
LKPLSVTLPFAARFTGLGDNEAVREAHSKERAKAKAVTVAKGQKGDAGAVFDLAPNPGSVSDQRAANGGVTACVKKAKKTPECGGEEGMNDPGTRGRDVLSLSRKGPEWSGRPFAEVQTRSARATRPSIAAGANGRESGTEGFSG